MNPQACQTTTTPDTPITQAQQEDSAILLRGEFTRILIQRRPGMCETEASALAGDIVSGLRELYGSQKLYVPGPDRSGLKAAVLRDFRGNNHGEVCRKHGISRATLYRWIGAPCTA